MKDLVVIDTNVLISALLKADTAPRQLFRLCLQQRVVPLMGTTLLKEYEEVMQRETLFVRSPGCVHNFVSLVKLNSKQVTHDQTYLRHQRSH